MMTMMTTTMMTTKNLAWIESDQCVNVQVAMTATREGKNSMAVVLMKWMTTEMA
jgi:hypothetical protein